MIPRICNLTKTRSFFLFGPRGVGKSTLLRAHFEGANPFWINLLESDVERRYAAHPERLFQEWKAQSEDVRKSKWIVIDEVQRIPRILVQYTGVLKNSVCDLLSLDRVRESSDEVLQTY